MAIRDRRCFPFIRMTPADDDNQTDDIKKQKAAVSERMGGPEKISP